MPDVSVLEVLLYGEQIGTLTLVQGSQTLCTNEVDGHHCSPKSRRLDAGSPERQPGSAQASDQTARDGPSPLRRTFRLERSGASKSSPN